MSENPVIKTKQLGFSATPQVQAALAKISEKSGCKIPQVIRDIVAAFLVSNGFLESAIEAKVCNGVRQEFFTGTPEQKKAVREEMRQKGIHMQAVMPKKKRGRPAGSKGKPKRDLMIAPAQVDEMNSMFSREQLKGLIADILKDYPELKN